MFIFFIFYKNQTLNDTDNVLFHYRRIYSVLEKIVSGCDRDKSDFQHSHLQTWSDDSSIVGRIQLHCTFICRRELSGLISLCCRVCGNSLLRLKRKADMKIVSRAPTQDTVTEL
jgi:hypothetical protein